MSLMPEIGGAELIARLRALARCAVIEREFAVEPCGDRTFHIRGNAVSGRKRLAPAVVAFAHHLAPSAIVAPFHYSQMISAVFFGLFLFGDIPDAWVIDGSAVIIGSELYILWRETVRGRTSDVPAASL